MSNDSSSSSVGRRNFIRESGLMIAGSAISGAVASASPVHGGGDDAVRVAVVGCGRRGRVLIHRLLSIGGSDVKVVALSDYFPSQTQATSRSLNGRYSDQVAKDCLRVGGADGALEAIHSDAHLVYLTTPPYCRPKYFRMAIEAGKHVFLEKPLAADPTGLREVMRTAALAQEKGLSVFVGFQRRHDPRYKEVIQEVRDGRIGETLFARSFCNVGPLPSLSSGASRSESPSSESFQVRNWNHFDWTGGDLMLEQHIAGLDVIHWALDQIPELAQGQGGWSLVESTEDERPSTVDGVYDHHSVEFEFDGGIHLLSQCRRVARAWNNTSEHLHGTLGRADFSKATLFSRDGKVLWKSKLPRDTESGITAQASFLLDSLRSGNVVSEVDRCVGGHLMAMLGLEASRSGKRIRMDKMVRAIS